MNGADNLQQEQAPAKRGELIAVCSAKGGIGRTVLAVNLAVALSKNNIQIALLDGDFQFGDVSLAMDLQPTFTIKDVAESMDAMDKHTAASYLIRHSSGVKVMAAPERPEQADLLAAPALGTVCDLLLAQHDYVLVDTEVGLKESTLLFVEKADQIFILTTLEMAAIKNTRLMLETLEALGLRHKVQLVVNRATMDSVIKATDVPDIVGIEHPYYVPNDFAIVAQSLNIGVPFVQNHGKTDIAKSIFKMAEQLISRREISLFKPKQPSFLNSLFHRTKGSTT
ncbi:histidine kinase [Gordoniibacillus kamchatkensis]|uniref:Histidine kinase n=1 Tax=Gordoniibacillus kamchatkensis TaxID=1590651 RepID=A0ABR5ABB5_9BACL|nr:AAA family ATPase [Paenibacillus sp. VKM B-2647]KIL38354.1 histidine kinase [Paenibacillus sp. VKM B-2647]